MYRALEFHDSELQAVLPEGDALHVILTGYIHQWGLAAEGWAGTGWTQQVRIVVDDASLLTQISELPADLSTGWIRSPGGAAPGLIQLPFQKEGAIVLYLQAFTGETAIVQGSRLSVAAEGEPKFVERLPGEMRPEELPAPIEPATRVP